MSNATFGLWQYPDGQLMKYNRLRHHIVEHNVPLGLYFISNGVWDYRGLHEHHEFGCERAPGMDLDNYHITLFIVDRLMNY